MFIGATGFEPAAFWSQTRRSTKLSYAPESATQTDAGDKSNADATGESSHRRQYLGPSEKNDIKLTHNRDALFRQRGHQPPDQVRG